ncbi:MAG: DoxX family protein [Cyclonatronaceae bacterium]
MSNSSTEKYHDLAILLLRIGVGIIFIVAGWGKLTGIEGAQGFFASSGVPLPGIMAWVVAIIEFVGGIMVLTGTYIRLPAVLLAIIMIGAIIFVKLDSGFGSMRLDILLLLTSLALFIFDSGKYSIDSKIGSKG